MEVRELDEGSEDVNSHFGLLLCAQVSLLHTVSECHV